MVVVTVREGALAAQADQVLAGIKRMQAELDAGPLTVPGSKGQPIPNGLLRELRAERWLYARLVAPAAGESVAPPVADAVDALRAEWVNGSALSAAD